MLGRPLWPNHHAGLSVLFLSPASSPSSGRQFVSQSPPPPQY
jgi:hypothetical protein